MSVEWKKTQYMQMGCSKEQAERLAATSIDVARARKMCSGGCSPDLMEKILEDTTVWDEIGYHQSNADKVQIRTGRQDG